MKRVFSVSYICSVILFFSTNAYAYMDPGTGSMLLQSVLGALLVIGGGVGVFWRKIKGLFNRSDNSEKKN